jgi:formate dehydrogenase alpha subunit
MINLKIDGKEVQIENGATILTAAEHVGIDIPTLCFLKKVSPTGACRICVVDIEGSDKPMTACNTPATEGMIVTTQNEKLATIRKQIVELLLVNHPLDCPVCDAGGECDLQNVCYDLDVDTQPFMAEDVNAGVIDKWPLIQQVPNRCVMCEKCVKVCHETIGSSALFINEKGDRAFIDKTLDLCEFCGNCVAVCPTGTMISKTFKFKARPWELTKTSSVCTLCAAQCQVDLNVKNDEVYRVTSKDDVTVNDGNLCIGGYFGYGYINSDQRLTRPQIKSGKSLKDVDWNEALSVVVDKIKAIRDDSGSDSLAGLSSPRLTNEENYLFQKLFRAGIGSNNIDSEARFGALRAQQLLNAKLGLKGASHHISHIGKAEAVLVFGADVTAEAPAIDWQIEAACRSKRDGNLVVANMRSVKLNRHANTALNYKPGSEVALANALGKLILDNGQVDESKMKELVGNFDELKATLGAVDISKASEVTGVSVALLEEAAAYLGAAASVALIFGADVSKGKDAEQAIAAVANLAIVSGALTGEAGGLFPIDEKGNMQGLIEMGVYPETFPGYQDYATNKTKFEKAWGVSLPESGKNAIGILEGIEKGEIKFLYLAATNPLVTFPMSNRWRQALEKIEFLVVQDILATELVAMADVVLPGASAAEKTGSVTALDNRVSCLSKAIKCVGDAREDWEIFGELCMRLAGKETCPESAAVLQEIRELVPMYEGVCFAGGGHGQICLKETFDIQPGQLQFTAVAGDESDAGMQLLSGKSCFHFGTTSTFAAGPLSVEAEAYIEINPVDAEAVGVEDGAKVKVTAGDMTVTLQAKVTESVNAGLFFAPYHFAAANVQALMPGVQNRVPVTISKG